MKFVTSSHNTQKIRSAALIAGAFIAILSYAAPSFAQVNDTPSDYEIILYDAETIARINAQTKVEEKPQAPIQIQAERVQPEQAIGAQGTGPQANGLQTIGTRITTTSTNPAASTPEAPRFPRDISAEFIDVIEGVPIMKDPQSCGKGLLEIGVTVENVASDKGTIVADLHDDVKENFLVWDKVVLRVRADAKKGETKFCMPLTRPGEYSIAVYHDKNDNKEFDKNFLGIPSEHFGMSNNPKFGLKSPEYEQAAFTVPDTGAEINIRLLKSSDILGGQKR